MRSAVAAAGASASVRPSAVASAGASATARACRGLVLLPLSMATRRERVWPTCERMVVRGVVKNTIGVSVGVSESCEQCHLQWNSEFDVGAGPKELRSKLRLFLNSKFQQRSGHV